MYSASKSEVIEYSLEIDYMMFGPEKYEATSMAINNQIPAPLLKFTVGDTARIEVTNKMDVETSVHWHGLLLPNFQDGVPYLTTPPILPGETFIYEFPLLHSGTYWYHSHTGLQEQLGIYGPIIIEDRDYSEPIGGDHAIVFSDWTDENPNTILKNLRRGNEWYNIKKGTAIPLLEVIWEGALGAQIDFWSQRMESMDIADIYYPSFLTNGRKIYSIPKTIGKTRLRFVNASASTQFWVSMGMAGDIVALDGVDIEPVRQDSFFIAIAETYDIVLDLPMDNTIEIKAMAQDGSGFTSLFIGQGPDTLRPDGPFPPDQIDMMKKMSKMDMQMGAPAMKYNPEEENPQELMREWGMEHSSMEENIPKSKSSNKVTIGNNIHSGHNYHDTLKPHASIISDSTMISMNHSAMFAEYGYDKFRSRDSSEIKPKAPIRKILLNLTGNMWRYIWSMNGVPLAETDKIKIKKGEIVQITLNNLTMMHHPMHLHGHFFRVLTKQGSFSPLKHTVNIPPMNTTTIEFSANADGDWFFHCHVLYHMKGGMARILSYGTPRDKRLTDFPVDNLTKSGDELYTWGTLIGQSNMAAIEFTSSDIRNQWNLELEYSYNRNGEADISYERYLSDYFRLFIGANAENPKRDSLYKLRDLDAVAVIGMRWLTPYLMDLDIRLDHLLRPEVRLAREIYIIPYVFLEGELEYRIDFGILGDSNSENGFEQDLDWGVSTEIILSRDFSLRAGFDNRFGWGGGLLYRL